MTHTAGPWRVMYSYEIAGPNGEDIGYANASDGADDPTIYPAEANARLIAAAPDLLAGCKALLAFFEGGSCPWSAAEAAKAAIQKAEGR